MDRLALALSALALVLSLTGIWLRPAPSAEDARLIRPTASPDAARVAALQRRVAALEARLAKRAPDAAAPDTPRLAEAPADDTLPPATETPGEVVQVRSPNPAVAVTVADGGDALQVRNTDPALTGQRLLVEVRQADGTVVSRPITVPPPE